jgi:hypothetical protein
MDSQVTSSYTSQIPVNISPGQPMSDYPKRFAKYPMASPLYMARSSGISQRYMDETPTSKEAVDLLFASEMAVIDSQPSTGAAIVRD